MHSFRPPKSYDTFVATVFGKAEKMSMMSMPKAEKMSMPKEKMSMPKADKTMDAKAEKMSIPKGKFTNPPSLYANL